MNKLAIIASGGGMRCAYSAGVIQALAEVYGITKPELVIGASGSAGSLAYYTSGQWNLLRHLWTNVISTTKLIKISRVWKILDIDYMIDILMKKNCPLDIGKFHGSKTKCLLAATNYETGKARYFENDGKTDIHEVMRATKALPLFYSKKVYIDGRPYCDSNLSVNIALHISEAVRRGVNKIIVIDNQSRGRLQRYLHSIWARLRKKKFKRTYTSHLRSVKKYKVPDHVDVFTFKVDWLPVPAISINKKLLEATFDQGYEEAAKSAVFKRFLKSMDSVLE